MKKQTSISSSSLHSEDTLSNSAISRNDLPEKNQEYIPTKKIFNTYYKYAFFNNKLGLVFKVNDGKVNLIRIEAAEGTKGSGGNGLEERIEFEDIPIYSGNEGSVDPVKSSLPEEIDENENNVFQNETIIELNSEEEEERLHEKMMKEFHEKEKRNAEKVTGDDDEIEGNEEIGSIPLLNQGVEERGGKKVAASPRKTLEYSEIAFSSTAGKDAEHYANAAGPPAISANPSTGNPYTVVSSQFETSTNPYAINASSQEPLSRRNSAKVPPPPPPPPPRRNSESTTPTAVAVPVADSIVLSRTSPLPPANVAETISTETYKILVESDHFFGPTIKRALKYTTSNRKVEDNIVHLLKEMKEKFTISCDISCLLVNYYDEDLSTYVVLDNDCWSDFCGQSKKQIQLSYVDRPTVPPPAPVVTAPIAPPIPVIEEVESKHEPVQVQKPEAPVRPPPPPPSIRRANSTSDAESNETNRFPLQRHSSLQEDASSKRTGINIAHVDGRKAPNSYDLYADEVDDDRNPSREILPPTKAATYDASIQKALANPLSKKRVTRRFKVFDLQDGPFFHYLNCYLRFTLAQSQKLLNPLPRSTSFLEELENRCSNKKWIIQRKYPPLGSTIYSINGVKLMNLDKDFQLALIRQRQRPLIIEFEFSQQIVFYSKKDNLSSERELPRATSQPIVVTDTIRSPSSPSSSKTNAPADNTIKFPLFMEKYSSSYASKLRKKVDGLLQDFIECDWAKAKIEKTGKAQATITSLYSYIESELLKLDLFNNKRSRGLGAPDELTEEHLDSLKDCIEFFIFKRISDQIKKLFPIYEEKVDFIPFTDYDEPPNMTIDPKLQIVAVNPLYYPIAAQANGTVNSNASNSFPVGGSHIFFRYAGGTSNAENPFEKMELSHEMPLSLKMAFLRFLSLENLGLSIGGGGNGNSLKARASEINPETTTLIPQRTSAGVNKSPYRSFSSTPIANKSSIQTVLLQINHVRQEMLHSEEWYMAIKGLSRALQLEIPYDILRKLNKCVNLISRALETYIMTKMKNERLINPSVKGAAITSTNKASSAAGLNVNTISASYYGEKSIVCGCGKIHLLTDPIQKEEITIPSGNTLISNPNPESSVHPMLRQHRLLCEYCPELVHQLPHNLPFVKELPNGMEGEEDDPSFAYSISADDLLPAIIWTLLQCNIQNIDYVFWICSEFRHPVLLRGEEAYCLAQLSSAIEFIKSANYQSFDLSRDIYSIALLQYNLTLKLLLACKNGDLSAVKDCLSQGADINGLSPDHRDSALSACIQFHQMEILRYLLSPSASTIALEEIQVDNYIHLFHGPYERCTALFVAILKECVESTILLLQSGANRYYQDDTGNNTLFKIVTDQKENHLLLTLLLADEEKYDYITSVMNHSERIVAGLLLQGINIHYLDNERSLLSPMITSILAEDIPILNLFLCNNCQSAVDINYPNSYRETPLLLCVKLSLLYPNNYRYVLLAAILLRNGANRYLSDIYGQSAISLLQEMDVNGYHPETSLPAQQREQLWNGAIGYYFERLQAENIPPARFQYDPFVLALFQSSEGLSGETTSTPTTPTTNPNYDNYALFYMKLLILTDPFSPTTITTTLPKASPIYEYARNRDLYTLKVLLLQGIDINQMSPQKGFNALISAVYNQDIEMLKVILQSSQVYQLTDYQSSVWFEPFYNYYSTTVSNYKEYSTNIKQIDEYRKKKQSLSPDINLQGRNGMTALHYAAQIGEVKLVGLLLQNHAKRDIPNQKQHLPLDIALANGHIDAANALRYDPVQVSICLAAKHGDWVVMKALLCQGISINASRQHVNPDTKEMIHELYTPLIAAVAFGKGELVKQLLELPDIDVNISNLLGQTPLMYAATRGDEGMILKLLKHGANRYAVDQADHNAVYWAETQLKMEVAAAQANSAVITTTTTAPAPTATTPPVTNQQIKDLENVIAILKNDPQRFFIHEVIRKNDFAGFVAMLKQNIDPNEKRMTLNPVQNTSTHWIAGDGPKDAESSPISTSSTGTAENKKLSRSNSTKTTLNSSDRRKSAKASGLNIPAGVDPNSLEIQLIQEIDPFDAQRFIPGETPLIVAARWNRLEILSLLLKAPTIEINLPDSFGHSALFHAAIKGNEEAVLLLLKHKANRRQLNKKNQSAVDLALAMNQLQIAALIEADPYHVHIHDKCEEGQLRHVIALLKQGCPPTFRDERPGHLSFTPLMAAAKGGKAEIVKMLLRYPEVMAGKDDRDTFGHTALMLAAGKGALDVTALLLNAGCDRNLTDNNGLSARDHASRHSYSMMFQFMGQTVVR